MMRYGEAVKRRIRSLWTKIRTLAHLVRTSIFQTAHLNITKAVLIAERDTYLRQRDEAIHERNEFLRQRDIAVGQLNSQADRLSRYIHRAEVNARRAAAKFQLNCDAPIVPGSVVGREQILFFLHLAKTGGVTLSDIFVRNLATEEFLIIDMKETEPSMIGTWSRSVVEKTLARLSPSEVEKLSFVWGHYRHGVQDVLPKCCRSVTLLRDPFDRVVSTHYYWDELVTKSGTSIDDYVRDNREFAPFIDNYMTRVLSGIADLDPIKIETMVKSRAVCEADFEVAARNLDNYLVVGLTDLFNETLLVLGSDLGWSLTDLVYRPLNKTKSRPDSAAISEATRAKIVEWNRFDAGLVERARVHLARRIAAYAGDFQKDLTLFCELNEQFQQGVPLSELRRMEVGAFARNPPLAEQSNYR